jgi:hypothetical protein
LEAWGGGGGGGESQLFNAKFLLFYFYKGKKGKIYSNNIRKNSIKNVLQFVFKVV